MSTDISVSVALEGLRRLSQGQINANRQAKLLEDQRKAAALKAVTAQQQGTGLDATATGRDAQGRFLYGAKLRPGAKPEEIAAYRLDAKSGWLLVPSDAAFNAIVGGLSPFSFTEETPDSTVFAVGEGPSAANALYAAANAEFEASTLTADSTIRAEPTSKSFTLEALLRLPVGVAGSASVADDYAYAEISIAQGAIRLTVNQSLYFLGGSSWTPANSVAFSWGSVASETDSRYLVVWNSNPYSDPDTVNNVYVDGAAPDATWLHIAMVQTPGASANLRSAAYYINGTRYGYTEGLDVTEISAPNWALDFPAEPDLSVDSGWFRDAPALGGAAANAVKIHGVRFTPRALYTGTSFTPPTTITSLA